MWHWNSLWAPAPGDPPAVDDPAVWRTPWSLEQSIAMQTRTWEAALSATHSWWATYLASLPMAIPSWPRLDEPKARTPLKAAAAHQLPPPRTAAPRNKAAAARKRPPPKRRAA